MQVIADCYLAGVSTRRVDKLVTQLGLDGISKSQMSEPAKSLDETVEGWRSQPLDGQAAAVSEDSAAWQVADELAGARGLHTSITPASGARQVGDLLTAEIKLQSGIADRFGIDLWLPAKAVMRTEDVP